MRQFYNYELSNVFKSPEMMTNLLLRKKIGAISSTIKSSLLQIPRRERPRLVGAEAMWNRRALP